LARTVSRKGKYLVDPADVAAEPFRTLRLAIDLRPDARTGPNLVFTSPEPGDGKTTVAANYALVSSLAQGRVLLVDADLRSPSIHEVFDIPRSPGLVELLRDRRPLEGVVQRVPYSDLDVLTAGAPVTRAGDVVSSPRMAELLASIAPHYDQVVIDAPPLLVAADAAGLASHPGTDVIVVVKRQGKRHPLLKALKKLELTEANVLGLVVNREGRLVHYAY
jgi:capsular exopolysaccharide synthesis family protein